MLAISALLLLPSVASGFAASPLSSCRNYGRPSIAPLSAVSRRQVAVIDGAELASIESFLAAERGDEDGGGTAASSKIGYMTVVSGTTEGEGEPRRVVGVEVANGSSQDVAVSLGGGVSLHGHTVATIPSSVNDDDAVSTMVAALVGVHCGLPRLEKVGGDDSDGGNFAGGKVVVLGGGEYAVFAADGLAALGAEVTLVSNGNPRTKMNGVKVMKPAVGEDDVGFSSVVGQFDCLVDTLFDEGKVNAGTSPSGVIEQLKLQHGCDHYVSTFSESQRIIRAKGLLFGRNDAKQYVLKAITKSATSSGFGSIIVPPRGFGPATVQKLLDEGVVFSAGRNKGKDVVIREWSLQDFWEYTSWPRDSEGSGNTRYGLPVLADDDAPLLEDVLDEEEDESEEKEEASPYVLQIKGVGDLNRKVVKPKKHAVVFMSATWCRKCKYLKPQYTRLAREAAKEGDSELMYAQADTTGVDGKMLSRTLDVDAVPAFVMFRDGRLYGEPLSISKLPSKQLDLAVEYLTSGKEFDGEVIREAKY